MAMAGMDHSGHAMHSLADDNPPANDCCYDGACPMIGCMGSPSVDAAALATDGLAPAGPLSAEYVTAYLNPATSSLFRPPIAC